MRIIFQLSIALLSLIAIVSVIKKSREHFLGPLGAFFWIIFWIAFVSIVSVPNITQRIADMIGIGRGVDLVMYISLAVLFFLVFKLYIKVEGVKRNIAEVARKQTLDAVKKTSDKEQNTKD